MSNTVRPRLSGDIHTQDGVLVNDEYAAKHCFKSRCTLREDFSPMAQLHRHSCRWEAHGDTAYEAFINAVKIMKQECDKLTLPGGNGL